MAEQQDTPHLHAGPSSLFSRRPSFFGGRKGQGPKARESTSANLATTLAPPSRASTTPTPRSRSNSSANNSVNFNFDTPPLAPNQYDSAPKVPSTPPRKK